MHHSLGEPPFRTVAIARLPITVTTLSLAADALLTLGEGRKRMAVHLVNAYTIALADRDPLYRALLRQPGVNLPDGRPLALIGRRMDPAFDQVRGPALFAEVLSRGRERATKHFLLGSTEGTLAALTSRAHERFPGVSIVGVESPPFRTLSDEEVDGICERIQSSDADLVWVGLGTPKQDYMVHALTERIPVVAVAVGAAFDFLAGTRREAPGWVQRIGLEWLFRLASEPKRLWRRYLFGNLRFLKAVVTGYSSMRRGVRG